MEDIVIGFDVGGTNVRAAIARVQDNGLAPHPDFPSVIKKEAGSKAQIEAFIRDVLRPLPASGQQSLHAVIALAGPVTHRRAVTMTNWPGPKEITLDEFHQWGLPVDRTFLLNDMEAGCYGLMSHLRAEKARPAPLEPLRGPALSGPGEGQARYHPEGNLVLLVPGTGLGAAGIVVIKNASGRSPDIVPVATEFQHTPMPVLPDNKPVVDWLRREEGIGHPSWDDVVSGRGLVRIYRALATAAPAGSPGVVLEEKGDHAALIARAGMAGDPVARRALSVFYSCLGRFAQLMALGFQAFGGVFIGGASTIHNRDFIVSDSSDGPHGNPLLHAFTDNPVQGSLLEGFPLYLVGEGDLNLDGALWFGHSSQTRLR